MHSIIDLSSTRRPRFIGLLLYCILSHVGTGPVHPSGPKHQPQTSYCTSYGNNCQMVGWHQHTFLEAHKTKQQAPTTYMQRYRVTVSPLERVPAVATAGVCRSTLLQDTHSQTPRPQRRSEVNSSGALENSHSVTGSNVEGGWLLSTSELA